MAKLLTDSKLSRFFIKEIIIYLVILIALALLWHNDLLTNPLARVERLSTTTQASPFHPLIWSGAIYAFIGIFRAISALFKRG